MKIFNKIESFKRDSLAPFQVLQVIIAVVCICIPVVLRVTDGDKLYYPAKINPVAISDIQNCKDTVKIDMGENPCWGKQGASQLTICRTKTPIICIVKIWKDAWGFRSSLSDYAYSSRSYLFGLLYCMAAMLFLNNGVSYLKKKDKLTIDKKGHWYNLLIGLCLIGVVFSPQREASVLHIIFTGLFFLGNLLTLFFYRNPKEQKINRKTRVAMGIVVLTAIILTLPKINVFTLLYAEWVSLTFFGIHLIMVIASTEKIPD